MPFISICIPTYKKAYYVERLLNSIVKQTFKDFEVIVSDDSDTKEIEVLCRRYSKDLNLVYTHNSPASGMPKNWNTAMHHASGEWIKIMHDDDWFAYDYSLAAFVEETKKGKKFICSSYHAVYDNGYYKTHTFRSFWKNSIRKNPFVLLAENVIGPPSTTLIHNSVRYVYDPQFKWRVDIAYYASLIRDEGDFTYTRKNLVNVGISSIQVTHECLNNPDIEISEALLLLRKYGTGLLNSVLAYDSYWRLFRNLGIKRVRELYKYSPSLSIPYPVEQLINFQSKIKPSFLRNGFLSTIFMISSYLLYRAGIKVSGIKWSVVLFSFMRYILSVLAFCILRIISKIESCNEIEFNENTIYQYNKTPMEKKEDAVYGYSCYGLVGIIVALIVIINIAVAPGHTAGTPMGMPIDFSQIRKEDITLFCMTAFIVAAGTFGYHTRQKHIKTIIGI